MLHIALCGISHQDEELLNMLQAYAPRPRETAPTTTHFNSAEQLLAGLKRGCFDLILIQLSLPDMDGIELAHSIHQQGYRIPVVFLADGPERAMEAYRAGALQYLVRPLEQPLLYHALETPRSAFAWCSPARCAMWNAWATFWRFTQPGRS